jgi:hypothetical protein
MQGFRGLREPVDKPGALLLAIREWQRQLIEMAQAAKQQATPATAGDYWSSDNDQFEDA